MLGNRREAHLEGFGDIRHGHVVLEQHGEDRAPRRIGQRGKDGIEGRGLGHAVISPRRAGPVNASACENPAISPVSRQKQPSEGLFQGKALAGCGG